MGHRRAFSLVELLIGLAITGFVMTGVTSVMWSGQSLAARQMSSGARLTTERFTLDSVYYEIRKGGNLAEVDVLDSGSVPPLTDVSWVGDGALSLDKYIFLAGDGRAILRERKKSDSDAADTPLTGADGILSLDFYLPTAGTTANDFLLSVNVVADKVNHSDNEKTQRTVNRRIGLLGQPDKNKFTGSTQTGNAVRFVFREVPTPENEPVIDIALLILDDVTKTLLIPGPHDKGIVLLASFDYVKADGEVVQVTGVNSIGWYVADAPHGTMIGVPAGDVVAELSLSSGDQKSETTGYYGTLSVPDDRFRTGITDAKFELSSGGPPWGYGFGYVYFVVDFDVLINGETKTYTYTSPTVLIDVTAPIIPPSPSPADGGFAKDLMNFAAAGGKQWEKVNKDSSAIVSGEVYADNSIFVVVSGDENATHRSLTLNVKNGGGTSGYGTKGIHKWVEAKYLYQAAVVEADERAISNRKLPYTNVANYSLVFDVEFDLPTNKGIPQYDETVDAFVVFLNGTTPRLTGSGAGIEYNASGYALAYDAKNMGFPAHLYNDLGARQNGDNPEGATLAKGTRYTASPTEYSPTYLRNSVFTGDFVTPADWFEPRRLMYTVLEYRTGTVPNEVSNFIVRAKILKSVKHNDFNDTKLKAISVGDPFFIGKDFYLSEPMWFGDFVGSSPVGDKILVRNMDNFDTGVSIDVSGVSGNLYGVQNSTVTAAFRSKGMSAPSYMDQSTNRRRFYGLTFMATKNNDAKITIHNFSLAPGFTPEELRAIMPSGGRLLSPKELHTVAEMEDIDTKWGTTEIVLDKNKPLEKGLWKYGDLDVQLGSDVPKNGPSHTQHGNVTDIQYKYYTPYYLR